MINLRKAEESDQSFLGEVCLSAHKLYEPFMGNTFIKQANKYQDALPSGYHIYIIEEGTKPLGFVGYKRREEKTMYITAFYLLDRYYGQGYGAAAMDYLVKQFQLSHMEEILLEVHKQADWAKRFYAKQGFTKVSEKEVEKNELRDKETVLLHKKITDNSLKI